MSPRERVISSLSSFLDRHGFAALFSCVLMAAIFYGGRAAWKDVVLPAVSRHFAFIDEQTNTLKEISKNQQEQGVILHEVHRHTVTGLGQASTK